MTFEELKFNPRPYFPGGIAARVFFKNGYGASIVRSQYSYGGDELGVLKGEGENALLCYDTPITSDVIGHLKPEDVTRILAEIEALN